VTTLPNPPKFETPIQNPDGSPNLIWWKWFETLARVFGGLKGLVTEAAEVAALLAEDTGVIAGKYGATKRVGWFRVQSDGRITEAGQYDIDGLVAPQSGWAAPTPVDISATYVEAEVQAINDRIDDLITSLRAAGVLED
jgi:hypothetical protein